MGNGGKRDDGYEMASRDRARLKYFNVKCASSKLLQKVMLPTDDAHRGEIIDPDRPSCRETDCTIY